MEIEENWGLQASSPLPLASTYLTPVEMSGMIGNRVGILHPADP
jgi:hypothetical protein